MGSKVQWNLPQGVDEILPPKALQIEKLRRRLIDLYISSGYLFIIPPLIEFSETLGGEAHEELATYAFSFRDDVTGKNLSIRPDISEQAARIDAYRFQSTDPVRLCYAGEVAKNKTSQILRSRTSLQVGAEIFGDADLSADIESINLMIESLLTVGIENLTLSLGHAGLISYILDSFRSNPQIEIQDIQSALSRKSESDILNFSSDLINSDQKQLLLDLSKLYGGIEIILEARDKLEYLGEITEKYLNYLDEVIIKLDLDNQVNIHIDLAEIYGFRYHNGIVFSAYTDSAGYSLSKGGRYDGISKTKNVPRSAVGFDLDLVAISNFTSQDS